MIPELPLDQPVSLATIVSWMFFTFLTIMCGITAWGVARFVRTVDERFGSGEKRMEGIEENVGELAKNFSRLSGEHYAIHNRRASDTDC
jgi:hypothetical protein